MVASSPSADDAFDEVWVVDAFGLGDEAEVAPPRRETRQRVHFNEARLSVFVAAQIEARDVATAQRPPGTRDDGVDARAKLVVDDGRSVVAQGLGPILFVRKRIDPRALTLAQEDDLHRRQDVGGAAVVGVAEDGDGELAAWQKFFNQDGLLVAGIELLQQCAQARLVVDDTLGQHTLRAALGVGFGDEGIDKAVEHGAVFVAAHQDAPRHGHAGAGDDAFGEVLVEGDGHGGGVRARVWHAQHVEQRRDLGFAGAAAVAFGDVEDEVDAGVGQGSRQR